MIDEKRMIEEFEKRMKDDNVMCPVIKVLDVLEIIEEQPKVGEWIPIGQYPSEPSLLCFEDGDILVGFYDYDYDEWTLKSRNDEYDLVLQDGEEPIAYMPLPPAYKGE